MSHNKVYICISRGLNTNGWKIMRFDIGLHFNGIIYIIMYLVLDENSIHQETLTILIVLGATIKMWWHTQVVNVGVKTQLGGLFGLSQL
jgi:hypothetical protein